MHTKFFSHTHECVYVCVSLVRQS